MGGGGQAQAVVSGSHLDASTYGTEMLETILGRGAAFDFPKSLYGTLECLRAATRERPNAVILDFFAGSGTTLHATLLLNAVDHGRRRCIIVTNNEVFPEETAKQLRAAGYNEGDTEFDRYGICQAVAFPRCKFAINEKRGDGTELPGDYLTGHFESQELRRAVRPLEFATVDTLKSKKAREALALALGFAKSKVTGAESFLLGEDERIAILLDPVALNSFIEQAEEWAESIETVYLSFSPGKTFNMAKATLAETWPPLTRTVEIKRPMRDGFAANLDYLKIDNNAVVQTDHLFVEKERFKARLNPWETLVLAAARQSTSFAGWLRNYARKPWSIAYTYRNAKGQTTPGYPDLVVFRREDDHIVVDLLEPHSPAFADSLAKAHGLCNFAEQHGGQFGRIEWIKVEGSKIKRSSG
jgi:hypothetical protein